MTTCRSWSIRCSANSPSAVSIFGSWRIPVFTVERDAADGSFSFRGDTQRRRPARKLHPHSCRRHRGRGAARRSRPRARRRACRRARQRPGLAGDAGARQRGRRPNCGPIRRRCRPTKSPKRSSFCNGSRRTISPCSAPATTPTPMSEHALEPIFETGLGLLALARHAAASPRQPARDHHAGNPRIPERAEAAYRHQGGGALARPPARASRLYRGQTFRRATAIWSANADSAACSPRPLTRVRCAPFPICAAKSTTSFSRAGFDPSSHSGKALVNVLETLSARRIVPDRRRHSLSVRARDPAARRAPARARAAATRPFRPLRVGPRLHSARPLRQPDPGRGSASISPRPSKDACAPSIRSSRKARWCASTSSSGATRAKRRTSTAPCSTARSKQIVRSWIDGLGEALAAARAAGSRRIRCSRVTATPFRSTIAKSMRRRLPSPISQSVEALTAEHPLGVELYREAGDEADERRPEGFQPQPPDPALRARAGSGKYGLPRRRRAHLSHRAGRRGRRLVSRHGAGKRLRRSRSSSPRSRKSSRTASSR